MTRTKWLRICVRDPADILRWAGEQDTRRLDDFRYRLIGGREFVSFRMVPRYAIEIGTSDIVVMAHVRPGRRQRLAAGLARLLRRTARRVTALRNGALPAEARSASLYAFPRRAAPRRG